MIATRTAVEDFKRFAQERPTTGGIHQGQRGSQLLGIDVAHDLVDWLAVMCDEGLYTGR